MQTKSVHRPCPAATGAGMLFLLLITLGLIAPGHPTSAAEAPKSWSGTWNNRKYKTNGPLTCTITSAKDGVWQAKFTGTGIGKPFSYDATINVRQSGNRTTLQGVSKIDGENYQWTGAISGTTLTGSYRSASGNNGDFRLQAGK